MHTGVEIETSTLSITSGDLLEGVSGQTLDFDFSMASVASSGSVSGSNLWQFTAFGSENADGSGATTSSYTVPLTSAQGSVGVTAGQTSQFSDLSFDLDLSGDVNCADFPYVCVTASKGPTPSPDYTLSGEPSDDALTACQQVECRGRNTRDL